MTTFHNLHTAEEAVILLAEAGWQKRPSQVAGSDFEAFIRTSGDPGLLLVDFAFGRFILDKDGTKIRLLTHDDDAEGDPQYDAILRALFEGEVMA